MSAGQRTGSGCGQRHALWTTAGPGAGPRGQLAALDPPLPDDEGAAGVEDDEEEDDEDDELSEEDEDDEVELAPSEAEALLRLSVR
jgi:hypothetical protein